MTRAFRIAGALLLDIFEATLPWIAAGIFVVNAAIFMEWLR